VRPPARLNRQNLRTEIVERRVFKAARRFEWHGLDIARIAMELSFERIDAPIFLARALGAHLKAERVQLTVPKHFGKEAPIFRKYLSLRRALNAVSDEKTTIRDFKRRTWNKYLQAIPLLTAIHIDILQYDPLTGEYEVELPDHRKRYLALSLLHNPQRWIHDVPRKSQLRRLVMEQQFPEASFAEILPENPEEDLRFTVEGS